MDKTIVMMITRLLFTTFMYASCHMVTKNDEELLLIKNYLGL